MSSFFPEYATSVIPEPYDSSQFDPELTPPPLDDYNITWNGPSVPFGPGDNVKGPFYFIYQDDTTKCLDGGTAMQSSKGLFECQQGNNNQQFYIDLYSYSNHVQVDFR